MNQKPSGSNTMSEEEYLEAMPTNAETGRKLFLVMNDKGDYHYSIYAVGEPKVVPGEDENEETQATLGKPLLRLEKSKYPYYMNFAAMGSRIFMVGGSSRGDRVIYPSNKVFIYDAMSSNPIPVAGPDLNSTQILPYLLPLGTKLFALSNLLYDSGDMEGTYPSTPAFEVLDVEDLENGWSTLPLHVLHFSKIKNVYKISALAAVFIRGTGGTSGFIFISVEDAGTYAFDIDNVMWNFIGDKPLPFSEQALTMPHDPSVCCAYHLKSDRFCAFRISYGGDQLFEVNETEINISNDLFLVLPPLVCCRPCQTAFGPNGEVYFVLTGVDDAEAYNANRYVKVNALDFSYPKIGDAKKDAAPKVDLDKRRRLKRCSNEKMKVVHDEEDETVDVDLKQSLRRCSSKKKKRMMMEHGREETKGLQLSGKWKMCYFGGPVCDELAHVIAAIAM